MDSSIAVQGGLSVARWVMAVGGTFIVTRGYMTQESFDQLLGAVLVVVPLVWGLWQKIQADRAAKEREVVALHVGIVVADNTVGPTPPIPPIKVPEVIKAIEPRIISPDDPNFIPIIQKE